MKLIDANGKVYKGRISVKVVIGTIIIWFVFGIFAFMGTVITANAFLTAQCISQTRNTVELIKEIMSSDLLDEEGNFDYEAIIGSKMATRLKAAAMVSSVSNAYIMDKNPDGSYSLICYFEGINKDDATSVNAALVLGNEYMYEGLELIQKKSNVEIDKVELDKGIGNFILIDNDSGKKSYTSFATVLRNEVYYDEPDNNDIIGIICLDVDFVPAFFQSFLFGCVMLVILLVVLVIGIVLYFIFAHFSISKPIKRLAKTASLEAKQSEENGVFNAFNQLEIKGNDEIAYFTSIMQSMEKSINGFIERRDAIMKEREHLEASLSIANQIQDSQLLKVFPSNSAFDVFASMHPAKEVGGDFYDCVLLDADHLYLCVADVSDKGIPAALFMMMAKIHLANLVSHCYSPKQVLRDINNLLCENTQDVGMFVTMWIGILDLRTGEMVCGNAGHENPVIKRAGGMFEEYKDEHDCVVAAFPDMEYNEYSIKLNPGDVLFLYTDGLPEAKNSEDEMFGMERVISELNAVPYEYSAKEIDDFFTSSVASFRGEAERFDDITLLTLKYFGKSE